MNPKITRKLNDYRIAASEAPCPVVAKTLATATATMSAMAAALTLASTIASPNAVAAYVAPPALEENSAAQRAIPIFNEDKPQLDGSGLSSSQLPQFKIPLDPPKVNLNSREEVLAYYHGSFGMMSKWWADWKNGSLENCVRGTTSRSYQESMVARMNFWRSMAGRPVNLSLKLDAEQSRAAQEAAMMLDESNRSTHTPSPTIKCYTAIGASGARGNLSVTNLPDAANIDLFIEDGGPSNTDVGHRIQMTTIDERSAGTGTTFSGPDANGYLSLFGTTNGSLVVPVKSSFGIAKSAPEALPAPGYTLHNLLPTSGRWHYIDPRYQTATAATVSLKRNGVEVPVTVTYRTGQEEFNNPTLVWQIPLSMTRNSSTRLNSGTQDDVFEVTISNLTQRDGRSAPDVRYTVTAINGFPGYADWNGDQRAVAVSEFYAPSQDTYFISPSRDDAYMIDELGSSSIYRTWRGFYAWATVDQADPGAVEVCRWYFVPPRSTHFYSAKQSDCDAVRFYYGNRPDLAQEESYGRFYVMPTNAAGGCDAKYQPVYRLFNGRVDEGKINHRYTAHPSDRRELIGRGWIDEGVAWCSPRKKENYWLDTTRPEERDWLWN
jgi:hypothetical protein